MDALELSLKRPRRYMIPRDRTRNDSTAIAISPPVRLAEGGVGVFFSSLEIRGGIFGCMAVQMQAINVSKHENKIPAPLVLHRCCSCWANGRG